MTDLGALLVTIGVLIVAVTFLLAARIELATERKRRIKAERLLELAEEHAATMRQVQAWREKWEAKPKPEPTK